MSGHLSISAARADERRAEPHASPATATAADTRDTRRIGTPLGRRVGFEEALQLCGDLRSSLYNFGLVVVEGVMGDQHLLVARAECFDGAPGLILIEIE